MLVQGAVEAQDRIDPLIETAADNWRLSRMAVEKAVLGKQYGTKFAKEAVENRSMLQTLAAYGVTKVATRSVPGALVVGTGLALKVLFDRSQSKRKARREGDRSLRRQAGRDDKN